jgi:O-antigen/teichoic acid export membrane protein
VLGSYRARVQEPLGTGTDQVSPPTPRVGGQALGWVALCIVGSGVLTYGYLALVAHALPSADYGWFGSYWSLALVVGFGTFLPVELELARLLHLRPATAPLPRGTVATLAGLAALTALFLLAFSGQLVSSLGGQVGFLVALLGVGVVSAGQFLLRGILLGTGRLGTHGVVLLVDSGLRVVLAAGLTRLAPHADGSAYAWTLLGAMTAAHLPLLAWVLHRRRRAAAASPAGGIGTSDVSARPFLGAVGHLLVGSLCAQVLLNAAPVLITGLAAPGQEELAARFVASYTLVRLPLFVAVPLQSAMIPVLTRLQAAGRAHQLRMFLLRGLAAVAVLVVAATAVGLLLGPWVVARVFGDRYALGGGEIALLAVGSVLHLALLVASQALTASARHRQVAATWLSGLVVACLCATLVGDLVLRVSLAFTLGSGVALVVAASILVLAPAGRPDPGVPTALPPSGETRT